MMGTTRIITLQASDDLTPCFGVRQKVFQQEQGIDDALDFDGQDEKAPTWHLLAEVDNVPAATVRVVTLEPSKVKVGRLAVLKEFRGRKLGKMLMEQILEDLPGHGVTDVELSAQAYLRKFYVDLGFIPAAQEHTEAGLPHIKMTKALRKEMAR